jgi:hypothetical protein
MTTLKTVEFAHAPLAAATNNTLTSLTQMTVYLPESTKSFKSVIANMSAMCTQTAVGNITSRSVQCRLGAAAYTAHSNANLYTNSGEDIFLFHAVDLTAHFNTNWTGSSMTFDTQVQLNSAATGAAWTNICVTLQITYSFDETASATQIKTVRIPLNAPTGALSTTKPGTALATIPNLSTYLPEATSTIRNNFITVQGNINRAAATDATMTLQLGTTTAHTTGVFEGLSNTDYFYRYVWNASTLVTSATNDFFIFGTSGFFNHPQIWLTVTYEFNASTTTTSLISLIIPMKIDSPLGGTTSTDEQIGVMNYDICETSAVIDTIAFFAFYDQADAIAGLNMRMQGSGAYIAYTDAATTLAGSNSLMFRGDETLLSVSTGTNSLYVELYRTDTTDLGFQVTGFWMLNYRVTLISASQVTNAQLTRTVYLNAGAYYDGAAATQKITSSIAVDIPDTNWYISGIGGVVKYFTDSTATTAGLTIGAQNGAWYQNVYSDTNHTDPETGLHSVFFGAQNSFDKFAGDPEPPSLNGLGLTVETAGRTWRVAYGNAAACTTYLDIIINYCSVARTQYGVVTGWNPALDAADGSGIAVTIYKKAFSTDYMGTQLIASTTTTAGGNYSFIWYNPQDVLFAIARTPVSALTGVSALNSFSETVFTGGGFGI